MQKYVTGYFNTSLRLIAAFDGSQPLSVYLKKYFSLHKKHGSKDRKWIAHFCYCYYRLGFACKEQRTDERLRIAVFLCTNNTGDWLSLYDEPWLSAYDERIDNRIQFIQSLYAFSITDIFFHNHWLSNDIDINGFNKSHLIQPKLFLRIRPGKVKNVVNKLTQNNISFLQENETCLSLDNATNINTVLTLNKEVVVQDFSSQKTASLFGLITLPQQSSVWDCCAASGGKSILAYDYFSGIQLTVSDIRDSIIRNLRTRFAEADIHHYTAFTADISSQQFSVMQQYDLVICDAPCSGSGTWSRTPEQLPFFTEQKLLHYAKLQKKMAANAAKAVKQNGYFLYITCSVYRHENEEIVQYMQHESHLKLVKAEVIKGYHLKADTMYAALFINQ